MDTPNFKYRQHACSIDYKGCFFASKTELRYTLSIENEYAYMREGLEIFYDPKTARSTLYHHRGIRSYTPDFLIRSWETGRSYLIEIKPKGYDNYEEMILRQKVSRHFINEYGYDWEFIIVFADEIILTDQQNDKYNSIVSNKQLYKKVKGFDSMDQRSLDASGRKIFRSVPAHPHPFLSELEYRLFIRKGVLPLDFRSRGSQLPAQ